MFALRAAPRFPLLKRASSFDLLASVSGKAFLSTGSGISGIHTAYELVTQGYSVILLEARDILSGETGRTSGHLASALDDGYANILTKHGAKELVKKHGIDCEYRLLPGYELSQYDRNKQPKEHQEEIEELKEEYTKAKDFGLDVEFREGFKVQGLDGEPDQRDALVFKNQAKFHPTKYLIGLLEWLRSQPNFKAFTHTRVVETPEKGPGIGPIGTKHVEVKTDSGHTVTCKDVVMATCVPPHKLSIVAEMEYDRTYCIAIKVLKGYIEDCLLYDEAEEYNQEEPLGQFKELETWTRERFTKAGSVDYAWSGQVFEPVDSMTFIGRDPGTQHTWIITGDSGNGLTHGVLAGEILASEIEGKGHPWSALYKPERVVSILKRGKEMLQHDLQINAQYKRLLQSDIEDIGDLPNGQGGVLNPKTKKPIAVYKDDEGNLKQFSALCPHMKGVVCWNRMEKSWDCPVHGSRFSKDGQCLMGPSKAGLAAADTSILEDASRA